MILLSGAFCRYIKYVLIDFNILRLIIFYLFCFVLPIIKVRRLPRRFAFPDEPIRIESDFDAALARNLAVEILKSQQSKRKEQQKLKSASEKSEKARSRLNSGDSFGNSWRNNFKPTSSANSQKSIRKARV